MVFYDMEGMEMEVQTSTNRDLVRFNSTGGNETWLDLCKRSKATIAIATTSDCS